MSKSRNSWIRLFSLLGCFLLFNEVRATVYEFHNPTAFNFDYSNSDNWVGNVAPPNPLGVSDTVVIKLLDFCRMDIDVVNLGTIINHGDLQLVGVLTNQGELVSTNNSSLVVRMTTHSSGIFEIHAAMEIRDSFINTGAFHNYSNNCLNSNVFVNDGLLHNHQGGVFVNSTNYPTKFLSQDSLINDVGGIFYVRSFFLNDSSGTLINNGEIRTQNTISAPMQNKGYLKNNGTINLDALYFHQQAGYLTGTGVIDAAFQIFDGGIVDPGDSIGTLSVSSPGSGFLEFKSTGAIKFQIPNIFNHDKLIAEDILSPAGMLIVTFEDDFQSLPCQEFTLIQYGQLNAATSRFDTVVLPDIYPDVWDLCYESDRLVLRHTPGDYGNNALDFGAMGEQSYVQINASMGTIRTLEFRFRPEKIDPSQPGEMLLSLDNTAFQFIYTMGSTSTFDGETLSLLNGSDWLYTKFPFEKKWYHITIASNFNGQYDRIFVDGQLVETFTRDGFNKPMNFDIDSLKLGARKAYPQGYTQGFFGGQLDEVRFWDSWRATQQIADNYYKELDISSGFQLKGYYQMNQGKADGNNACVQIMTDVSGNNNDGILHGFTLNGNGSNWVSSTTCSSIFPEPNIYVGNNGADPTNWHMAGNWSVGVPSACHHAVIPNGQTSTISANNGVCHSIEIELGASLVVEQAFILDVTLKKPE